ncbi:Zinc finger C2H2 [Echinococcus multilocularis]|uniref:Zinc finger C2H2 n=1 Tax=Echinococcus multilocularis TaxID=6211 RepID=A0A068YBA3_ECHMU|nr:Zinc finger C2H2 [Echinococcus multilocularis]
MSEVRFPSGADQSAVVEEGAVPLQICEITQKSDDLCSPKNMKAPQPLLDVGKENIPPGGLPNQPTSTPFKPITNRLQQIQPAASNYSIQLQYQLRRPVEPWKYQERKSSDGLVTFACRLCCAVYKHKKSLNKHWKDKHTASDGSTGMKLENESDSQNDSRLTKSASASVPRPSPPVHRMRTSLRRLPQESPSTMLIKRRRSDIPISSIEQSEPLDLSMARPRDNEATLERVTEVDVVAPLRDRVIITLLIQSALDALKAEPPSVQTTDAVSSSTCSLLRAVGSVLIGSTEPRADPIAASSDRKRSEEAPVPCHICPYVGRWQSEVKAHVVNHSSHKMFGCCFCNYRSKWKWDVAKHMRKCFNARSVANLPNEALIRMIIFHPPPANDILHMYYSENASSSPVSCIPQQPTSQPPTSLPSNSSRILVQINALKHDSNDDHKDYGADDHGGGKSDGSRRTSIPTDPPVLEPAVKFVEEEEEERREMSQDYQPISQTQVKGEFDGSIVQSLRNTLS